MEKDEILNRSGGFKSSQYVSAQGLREAHLYSHRRLPGWVGKLDLEVRFGRSYRQRTVSDGVGQCARTVEPG